MSSPTPARIEPAAILAGVGLGLVGWTGLLVPSLVRQIEPAFGQTDAGIGVFFFVSALGSLVGSMGGGLLTERVGRRVVLTGAVSLLAVGMALFAVVPSWTWFLVASVPFGVGMGGIDGGMNGLVLDLYPSGRGRALNLLHLCFSLGALASPLVVGRVVDAGASWQAVILASVAISVPLAILFAVVRLPSGRHVHAPGTSAIRTGLALPLVLLAIAIACYVGSEIGVSNWLVRYLEAASLTLATSALALFWGCLALGRLVSARLGDRFDHAWFAATSAIAAAVALVAAIASPSLETSIVLFGVSGFAFGPVYPLIMAVAGDRYPARSAAVSGFLSGVAVIGGIIYPPLMGFVSVDAGLGVAMVGAAALVLVCGLVLVAVARRPVAVTAESVVA